MKGIAVYEAKARLSELLAAVEAGEEFNITRHGKPVARLVAAQPDSGANEGAGAASRRKAVVESFKRLRKMRTGVRLEGDIKSLIAEGRD